MKTQISITGREVVEHVRAGEALYASHDWKQGPNAYTVTWATEKPARASSFVLAFAENVRRAFAKAAQAGIVTRENVDKPHAVIIEWMGLPHAGEAAASHIEVL